MPRKTGRKRSAKRKTTRAASPTGTVKAAQPKAVRAGSRGKALGARAREAGRRLVAKVKSMNRKKLTRAAAATVGVGVAAIGAVVATRKARRRKRRLPFLK